MPEITTLFWDVGGVLLTNGWDTDSRRRGAERFGLDWDDFQERHELVVAEFEKGDIGLDEYLECTVFHRERDFSRETFREFMFQQSRAHDDVLELVDRLVDSGDHLMVTLNNESRPLNLYRIEEFGLRDRFAAFFSSGFLGIKKPEKAIYRTALEVTQRRPEECLFIDDRPLNLETAQSLGIHTIHHEGLEALEESLVRLGIDPEG